MQIVLLSTYELGRQPFGLASPAAWLRADGHQVRTIDLAISALDDETISWAEVIGLYVPMHAATRRALSLVPRLREINPAAHLAAYGLYAPLNAAALQANGFGLIVGGEFEAALSEWVNGLASGAPLRPATPQIRRERVAFLAPERDGLPPLERYARLEVGERSLVVGYSEASRGCKHLCRHCPVVPVYQGLFRVVPVEIVLEDVRRQVAAGAQHITFGDPDFFNGPTHARRLVTALHQEFPRLSYDVTIKVSHLIRHAELLPMLRQTGCIMITSAVESFDDQALEWLDKGHTRAEVAEMIALVAEAGISLNPTFVAFCPWTSRAAYRDFLLHIAELGLVGRVAPVQYAIRLLLPHNSRLLELPQIAALAQPFDEQALAHPWRHPDPTMDQLQRQVEVLARDVAANELARQAFFAQVWALVSDEPTPPLVQRLSDTPDPFMTEPWYC